ncbi:hypothetical protein JCM5350_001067 [Sporobolomyces pararoseus]
MAGRAPFLIPHQRAVSDPLSSNSFFASSSGVQYDDGTSGFSMGNSSVYSGPKDDIKKLKEILGFDNDVESKLEELVAFTDVGFTSVTRAELANTAIGLVNMFATFPQRSQNDEPGANDVVDKEVELLRASLSSVKSQLEVYLGNDQASTLGQDSSNGFNSLHKLSSEISSLVGTITSNKRTASEVDQSASQSTTRSKKSKGDDSAVSSEDSRAQAFHDAVMKLLRRITGRVFYSYFLLERQADSEKALSITYAIFIARDYEALAEIQDKFLNFSQDRVVWISAHKEAEIKTVVRNKLNHLRNKTLVDSFDSQGLNPTNVQRKDLVTFAKSLLSDYVKAKDITIWHLRLLAYFRFAAKEFKAREFKKNTRSEDEVKYESQNNNLWWKQVDDGLGQLQNGNLSELEEACDKHVKDDLLAYGGSIANISTEVSTFDEQITGTVAATR